MEMCAWQAMDSSHVSLVSLHMKSDGFEHFRCDRNLSLGMNLASLTKVLKCSGNDDVVTLKADDAADTITVMFESKSTFPILVPAGPRPPPVSWLKCLCRADEDRISDFEIKLMDIDSEHLGIPETDYNATIKMPSAEFQRIVRDLTTLGDTGECPHCTDHSASYAGAQQADPIGRSALFRITWMIAAVFWQ